MKAYSFDSDGIYIGECECQKDPVRSQRDGVDRYLLPANATLDAPPVFDPSTQRAVWDGVSWKVESLPEDPSKNQYPVNAIPTPIESAVTMMRAAFVQQCPSMEDDAIIQCSGLVDDWKSGNHLVGEVYNTRSGVHAEGREWEQTWECYQAYDNAVYPDIVPGNSAWYTFNRPLHGKSPETARPFVKVQGAHDMYHSGEYMVWTDGSIYRCLTDTNFSPEEYPNVWEKQNNG